MSNHDRLTTTPAVNNSIGIHGTIVTKKWHQRFMKNQGYHHERSSVQKPVIYSILYCNGWLIQRITVYYSGLSGLS